MEIEDKKLEEDVATLMGGDPPKAEPPAAPEPPATPPAAEPPEPAEPPPAAEPPKAEPPKGEPPAPTPEPPAAPVQLPTPVAPAPPAPPIDPKDAELAELKKTVEHLRGLVESAARQAATPPAPQPLPLGPDGKPVEAKPTVYKFIEKEEELDKVLDSVDSFNGYMTKVVEKAQESVLTSIPQLVARMADQVVTQKMAVMEFYQKNQDLTGNKAYVGMVANELAAAHPDWNMEKIITELGPEVRNKLRLAGIATQPSVQPPANPPAEHPAFVPGSPARPGGGVPQMTAMEKDIASLIEGM
jgi:hypothetical protein